MSGRVLLVACMFAILCAHEAKALPVEYSLTPKPGFVLLKACEDDHGPRTSEVHLKLSSSRLEPARTVGLDIHVTLCVLFSGVVEQSYSFRSFPIVAVLSTPLYQTKIIGLDPADVDVLQKQTGRRLRPVMSVEHNESGKRSLFNISLLDLSGDEVAMLNLELGDEEASRLPGFDYQTQLPILAFSASYDGLSLSSTTRSMTTVGLLRKPVPARAQPRACTMWEKFVSFFRGANPNCL